MASVFGSDGISRPSAFSDHPKGAPIAKLFISYGLGQAAWVEDRLVPVLQAGGAERPLLHAGGGEETLDTERSAVGSEVARRLYHAQDEADRQIVVLSPDYVANVSCDDQLKAAVAKDPDFRNGTVIPILREACSLPAGIEIPGTAMVDLRNERREHAWEKLLGACRSDLGVSPLAWLKARDQVLHHLETNQSVNLVFGPDIKDLPLLADLRERCHGLATIELTGLKTGTRRGLVTELLRMAGCTAPVPLAPDDLEVFETYMGTVATRRIILTAFDTVKNRFDFDQPLFESLAWAIGDTPPRLVLLLVSQQPLTHLLPGQNPLVKLNLSTVTLAR